MDKTYFDTYTTYSPYLSFDRPAWSAFKRNMPFKLTEGDLEKLQGQYESISLREVIDIYLPLSRLLNLYVTAAQKLFQVTAQFLDNPPPQVPYIIAIAGSVAVGKSTTSRVLQALLSHWDCHPQVEIVTTDGFLFPNAVLEEKNLLQRKGFPESYDLPSLINFLGDLKAGKEKLQVPVYSHEYYDIISDIQIIQRPQIVIIEGLNLLQHNSSTLNRTNRIFVSDYFDFSIYVDAKTCVIKQWYLDRFMKFRKNAINHPQLFMHQFSSMTDQEASAYAQQVWHDINELNLIQNILPYRQRAKLILHKGHTHAVEKIYLRKI